MQLYSELTKSFSSVGLHGSAEVASLQLIFVVKLDMSIPLKAGTIFEILASGAIPLSSVMTGAKANACCDADVGNRNTIELLCGCFFCNLTFRRVFIGYISANCKQLDVEIFFLTGGGGNRRKCC